MRVNITLIYILVSSFCLASRIVLKHIKDREFELWVPNDIKFNVAYVYNNVLNKVSETTNKNFALEFSRDKDDEQNFTFVMPEGMKSNLYYGVTLEDQKGIVYYSNRYFCASNDEFYIDKSAVPKKVVEQSENKKSSWLSFNWQTAGIVALVALAIIVLSVGGYFAYQKYKKRREVQLVDVIEPEDTRPVRFS
ncbi:hypothetical protein M153_18340001029 [Pseudoloma neurophilia]|uniref:Uncharacterized protein n=1 Tax=Pseudoloma neurophilia TaxID=146866 RepID=A0A0R0M1U2_9MICR|nr:hypothetical protein M153_18340001029 [Pseudoloma neurophilia]